MADIAKWGADVIDGRYYVFEGQEPVAECYGTEEDTRLIAAAPEMYELLKRLKGCWAFLFATPNSEMRALYDDIVDLLKRIDGDEQEASE